MRRREFIALLGSAAAAWPLAARAQQSGKMHRLGYIGLAQPNQVQHLLDVLRAGLREHGWIEGQNFAFDFRWAEGRSDRVPALAADLVRAKVDIIIVASTQAAQAASSATTSIPIVMAASYDALAEGLVESLARPGGNLTGLTGISRDLVSKQLEILKELVPSLSQVAVLVNPTGTTVQEADAGSRVLGLQLHIFRAGEPGELQGAFEAMSRERTQALVVMADAMFFGNRARIAELATGAGVPTVAPLAEHAMAGTLVAYGPNLADMFRRATVYIDKILRGAKPADLPIEQPTKFDLTINLKTAKALGLTVPPSLLARADEVIE
jgi:ABC-type uncharacterized transport system substrate-binding protein